MCLYLVALVDASEFGSPLQLSYTSRVVAVSDPRAVERFSPDAEVVYQMFNRLLLAYAKKDNLPAAWSEFVTPSDVVGIKVLSDPGSVSGTRPAVGRSIGRSE